MLYTGAGGWGKIAAEISGGMLWRSEADKLGKVAEVKRNAEQKWVRPPTNVAATIFISPSRRRYLVPAGDGTIEH